MSYRLVAATLTYLALTTVAYGHDSLSETGGTPDRGAIQNGVGGSADFGLPWVRKYYSPAGACFSLKITEFFPNLNTFLYMTVLTPVPGVAYRYGGPFYDSSCYDVVSGDFKCPWVQIDPTPVAGYYTVIVAGSVVVSDIDFILEQYRAAHGDPVRCPSPTPPLSLTKPK
jgi:hypothetical protein